MATERTRQAFNEFLLAFVRFNHIQLFLFFSSWNVVFSMFQQSNVVMCVQKSHHAKCKQRDRSCGMPPPLIGCREREGQTLLEQGPRQAVGGHFLGFLSNGRGPKRGGSTIERSFLSLPPLEEPSRSGSWGDLQSASLDLHDCLVDLFFFCECWRGTVS